MICLLVAISAAAAAFQLLALIAAIRHLRGHDPIARSLPPVSVLKPIHGLDEDFAEAIRSHALVDYPEYELLFGVNDPRDPAVAEIERLAAAFPERAIRLIVSAPQETVRGRFPGSSALSPSPQADAGAVRAANGKVGVLMDLAAAAHYPILVVNDSDIRVPPDYLRRVVAPLDVPAAGMVTCLYRGRARNWPGRFESAGIATDFVPGVLVAPLAGVSEFALGSTMAFRAVDLKRSGGFAAIADYLADDYQLSRRIRELGLKVVISRCVVETLLGRPGWREMWTHQVRWARTIRRSRPGGYFGLPVANAAPWSILLAIFGLWPWAAALYALRLAAGLVTGVLVLGNRPLVRYAWLIPIRDLAGLAIWAGGLAGSSVVWRGKRLRLTRDGRIVAAA